MTEAEKKKPIFSSQFSLFARRERKAESAAAQCESPQDQYKPGPAYLAGKPLVIIRLACFAKKPARTEGWSEQVLVLEGALTRGAGR